MSVTERGWLRMYRAEARSAQNGRCAYCCAPLKACETTADHVQSIKRGGMTMAANIKAACQPCNKLKGHMGAARFLRLIKNPQPGDGLSVWLAWSRRRIWAKTHRACERIQRSAA